METLPSKTCSKCKQVKPLSDFNKDSRKKEGVRPQCKECVRQRYIENREKHSAINKRWYENNKDRKRDTVRLWRRNNPEKFRAISRRWWDRNSARACEMQRLRRLANPEKARERWRKYSLKVVSSSKGKINAAVRSAVHRCIGGNRGSRTFGLLGYTVDDLMRSLEAKFRNGMSWANQGEWHIDHIRPISSFNFSSANDPEFHECWSLENLQPLWACDNLSKGARYER